MHLLEQKNLTIRQKLGMVFCARPKTETDLEYTLKMIREHALGCVQVPPGNREWMHRIHEAADYPLLIICDTEQGLPSSNLPKVSLMTLSACNNPEYYRLFAKAIASEAREEGFNGTWGPVIDLLHGDAPVTVARCFSDDPMKVAKCAEEIATVYKQYGYLSCGKHYPGGSNALPFDTHMAPAISEDTEEELRNKSLIPYQYLMEKGLLPSIMTSHKKFPNIDPDNAGTLSLKVHEIIRDMGFDGVCFTDSIAMMAILQQYGEENVLGLCIAAGNDIVLPNYRTSVEKNFEYLTRNFEDGLFTEARLDESVRRVLNAQAFVGAKPEKTELLTDEEKEQFRSIARDCITAVCDPGVAPSLAPEKRHLFVIITDPGFDPTLDAQNLEIRTEQWYHPTQIAQKIREEFPQSGVEFISEYPTARDNERILVASTNYDDVVFVTFCTTGAYLGTDCLTRRMEGLIDCINLSGRLAATVHFGNPFALKHLLHVPRKIFGYDMPMAQSYAVEVLAGKLPARGTLPFRIPFQ